MRRISRRTICGAKFFVLGPLGWCDPRSGRRDLFDARPLRIRSLHVAVSVAAAMCAVNLPLLTFAQASPEPFRNSTEPSPHEAGPPLHSSDPAQFRDLVADAEAALSRSQPAEALPLLFEVAESPRFERFHALDAFRAAEFLLSRALLELGAHRMAQLYLLRILRRDPSEDQFGPAMRLYTDVALQSGELRRSIEQLGFLQKPSALLEQDQFSQELPEDSANELRYLQGRLELDRGNSGSAEQHLGQITAQSRFFSNAQYLRGAIAAQDGEYDRAEALFCSVAANADRRQLSSSVNASLSSLEDDALLGLGRVAHERRRGDDAFNYYFQVPADSARVSEALFEAAYAMYEAEDFDIAIDLLDQLRVRLAPARSELPAGSGLPARSEFPVLGPEFLLDYEAGLLRGYVHLARCEFEKARQEFARLIQILQPVDDRLERLLADPERRQALDRWWFHAHMILSSSSEHASSAEVTRSKALLAVLFQIDPGLRQASVVLRALGGELERAAPAHRQILDLLRTGADGGAPQPDSVAVEQAVERVRLGAELREAEGLIHTFYLQLAALRQQSVELAEIHPIEKTLGELEDRARELRSAAFGGTSDPTAISDPAPARWMIEATSPPAERAAVLSQELRLMHLLEARASALRNQLIREAARRSVEALIQFQDRIGAGIRQAELGQIDAVMGSKRRIEHQIESLAAGRFPPELFDPRSTQGLLRDDEEYWPFDGEYWEDEYEEHPPVP